MELYSDKQLVEFEFGGQKRQALVTIQVSEDFDVTPEGNFDFGDETENAEYLARFHSGELVMTHILVKALYLGVEGFDSLGACHLKASDIEGDALDMIRDHGMVENAIDALKAELDVLAAALK